MVVMDLIKKNRLFLCLVATLIVIPSYQLFGEDLGGMPSAVQTAPAEASPKQIDSATSTPPSFETALRPPQDDSSRRSFLAPQSERRETPQATQTNSQTEVVDAETQKIIDSHENPSVSTDIAPNTPARPEFVEGRPTQSAGETEGNPADTNDSLSTPAHPEERGTSVSKGLPESETAFPMNENTLNTKTTTPKKTAQKKNIYLNFENTSLANFVNYIAEMKKMNLIPDKGLTDAKVSLSIRDPLTVDGAWTVFLTVIEMAGFTIVKAGDVYKVVPKDQKLTQPLPVYINVPVETLPDSDLVIRYVTFLQNLNVEAVQDLLKSMLSEKSSVVAQKEVSAFVVTDKSYNIKAAVKLLKELDTGQSEVVVVIKLKTTNAEDVKGLLTSLIKQPDGNPLARLLGQPKKGTTDYFPPGTRIISEPRTNSLILLGTIDSIKKIESFIVNHVDTDLKEAESPLHIYELQFTDAKQIATILSEVTGPSDSGPGQEAEKYGAIRGGVKYFKKMNFQADEEGNRLIVASTDREDWNLLEKTIRDLDKPQPQVAIESYFVSIKAEDEKKLGGAIRNKKHNQLGKNIDFQSAALAGAPSLAAPNGTSTSLLGNMLNQVASTQGSTILSFGKSTNIWAVLQAFKTETNSSILSQPFITVANKAHGLISIGQTSQVLQSESATGQKGFTPINANTVLDVTPQINLDGIITMDITVDINEFINPAEGNQTKKNIKTNVTMADGQVLVLGGFIQTTVSEDVIKTPFFGDIPLLGWFFKSQDRTIAKNYIFIFLCPTIIKPRQAPGIGLYTKMKMHQATDQIESSLLTSKSKDPLFNWFFDPKKENYSHKVIDFANARYQPTTVDIKNDPYYRVHTQYKDAEKFATDNSHQTEKIETSIKQLAIAQPLLASVQPQQTGVAIDSSLQQKRDLLKAMVAQPLQPQKTQPVIQSHESSQEEKVSNLKELISTLPTPDNQPMNITIDPEKRKNLKQLLSMREQHAQP